MAHSVDNYISGNGIAYVYLRPIPYVPPLATDYEDMGDVVQFEFTPKITKKDYWGHRTGVRALDKRVKVKEEGVLKITLSEFFVENLQKFLMGTLTGSNQINIMEGGTVEFGIKFVEVNISGPSRTWEFWRADISPAAALQLIRDGEGEGDWGKLELEVMLLDDSLNHPEAKWGITYLTPTT